MSLAAYMWAADLPLGACSPTAFRVLLKYADRVDELGYHGWHSEAQLSESLECSERTIRRARAELVELELMRRSHEQDINSKYYRTDRRPVVYDVLTTALQMHELHGGTFLSARRLHGGTESGRTGGHRLSTETVLKPIYQDLTDRGYVPERARVESGRS